MTGTKQEKIVPSTSSNDDWWFVELRVASCRSGKQQSSYGWPRYGNRPLALRQEPAGRRTLHWGLGLRDV